MTDIIVAKARRDDSQRAELARLIEQVSKMILEHRNDRAWELVQELRHLLRLPDDAPKEAADAR
jgi:hypothetical protein